MKNEELEDQMVVKTPDYKFKSNSVFSIGDAEEARLYYLGKKGLFFDRLGTKNNFLFDKLDMVADPASDFPFRAASNGNYFRFFVPEHYLQSVEKEALKNDRS